MKYIVVGYTTRETRYLERPSRVNSLYTTADKSKAHQFNLSDAIRIADHHGMSVEEADE